MEKVGKGRQNQNRGDAKARRLLEILFSQHDKTDENDSNNTKELENSVYQIIRRKSKQKMLFDLNFTIKNQFMPFFRFLHIFVENENLQKTGPHCTMYSEETQCTTSDRKIIHFTR